MKNKFINYNQGWFYVVAFIIVLFLGIGTVTNIAHNTSQKNIITNKKEVVSFDSISTQPSDVIKTLKSLNAGDEIILGYYSNTCEQCKVAEKSIPKKIQQYKKSPVLMIDVNKMTLEEKDYFKKNLSDTLGMYQGELRFFTPTLIKLKKAEENKYTILKKNQDASVEQIAKIIE